MLEYFALAVLLVGLLLVFYVFIYIHDLPYETAKRRNHPQLEAIHYACVLSLFTLHAIWPIVFIWAVSRQGRPAAAGGHGDGDGDATGDVNSQLARLEQRLARLEGKATAGAGVSP